MSENSLREIVQRGVARLRQAGIPSPGLDVQLLVAFTLGLKREEVILRYDDEISYEARMRIEDLVGRRVTGEPMAYIRGIKEFWSLVFKVDQRVMIPRPDTEVLIERCVRHARERVGGDEVLVVDVGTGSGAIACAIAAELGRARVMAVDISKDAIDLARENIENLGFSDRIRLVQGDLLSPFRMRKDFDIISTNLPYIPRSMIELLPDGIKKFEPRLALDGGEDGFDLMRRFLGDADKYVRKGGIVALEVEDSQVDAVQSMMNVRSAYSTIGVDIDLAGFKRVVWAEKG